MVVPFDQSTGQVRRSCIGRCPIFHFLAILLCLDNLNRNTKPGRHMINTVASDRYASMLALNVMIELKKLVILGFFSYWIRMGDERNEWKTKLNFGRRASHRK